MRNRIKSMLKWGQNQAKVGGYILSGIIVGGAGSAVVWASIPDANGVIHGCMRNNGDLRIIDSATEHCTNAQTPLNFNQTGPRGPQGTQGSIGPQGPAGPAGPPGSTTFTCMRCDFTDSEGYFKGKNLSGVYLISANFSNIDMSNTNFSEAILRSANFQYTVLTGVNFLGADLRGADLTYTDLTNMDFQGANLGNVNLRFTTLTGTSFVGANLNGTVFNDCDIRPNNLAHLNLSGAHFENCNFADVDFRNIPISATQFGGGSNLTNTKYMGITSPPEIVGADLTGADFTGANVGRLSESNINNVSFRNVHFTDSYLAGSSGQHIDFSGAVFSGQARIDNINWDASDFTDADLRGTVSGSGPSSITITNATWSNTICPDGTNSDDNGDTCTGHFNFN